MGALLGEPGGRAPLLGALKVMKGRLWGMGIPLYGGSVRQPGVGLSTRDFEIWLKGTLEVWCLSLWELCEGNLEGGPPCCGPWRICRKGSGDGRLFP